MVVAQLHAFTGRRAHVVVVARLRCCCTTFDLQLITRCFGFIALHVPHTFARAFYARVEFAALFRRLHCVRFAPRYFVVGVTRVVYVVAVVCLRLRLRSCSCVTDTLLIPVAFVCDFIYAFCALVHLLLRCLR